MAALRPTFLREESDASDMVFAVQALADDEEEQKYWKGIPAGIRMMWIDAGSICTISFVGWDAPIYYSALDLVRFNCGDYLVCCSGLPFTNECTFAVATSDYYAFYMRAYYSDHQGKYVITVNDVLGKKYTGEVWP